MSNYVKGLIKSNKIDELVKEREALIRIKLEYCERLFNVINIRNEELLKKELKEINNLLNTINEHIN